jgi:hypothetical protein
VDAFLIAQQSDDNILTSWDCTIGKFSLMASEIYSDSMEALNKHCGPTNPSHLDMSAAIFIGADQVVPRDRANHMYPFLYTILSSPVIDSITSRRLQYDQKFIIMCYLCHVCKHCDTTFPGIRLEKTGMTNAENQNNEIHILFVDILLFSHIFVRIQSLST